MSKLSRKEELEAELAALQSLDKIEERRTRSLHTHVTGVNKKYDEQRAVALQSIPAEVQAKLAVTDEAHQAYLVRQGEPLEVEESDLQVVEA